MNNESIFASISVFLYSVLAIVSLCYYLKFKSGLKLGNIEFHDHGKYDEPKAWFFLVLFFSAVMDLPRYTGCIVEGGPEACDWDNIPFQFYWSLSQIASIGYLYTIVFPPVLWSDIIAQQDGKLWFSSNPVDSTKRFFQVSIILFSIFVFLSIAFEVVTFFFDYSYWNIYESMLAVRAFIILVIIGGALYCGIVLQYYVVGVKIGDSQKQFLMELNITLVFIFCAYFARALYVVKVFDFLNCPYIVDLVFGFWIPRILCSFILIREMSYSSVTAIGTRTRGSVDSVFNSLMTKEGSYHSLRYNSDDVSLRPLDYENLLDNSVNETLLDNYVESDMILGII